MQAGFSWTPSEAQGRAVPDYCSRDGQWPASRNQTVSFTVTVNEVNSLPLFRLFLLRP